MLASDKEREAAILRLRAAHLEGRFDTDELEARVERAQAARTRAELDALGADLPERRAAPVAVTTAIPRMPGRRHFDERKLLDASPAKVRESALFHIVPALERHGFYLHRDAPDSLTFASRREMASHITVRLHEAGDGRTLVHAHGVAPLPVRRAFATLSDD